MKGLQSKREREARFAKHLLMTKLKETYPITVAIPRQSSLVTAAISFSFLLYCFSSKGPFLALHVAFPVSVVIVVIIIIIRCGERPRRSDTVPCVAALPARSCAEVRTDSRVAG